MEEDHYRYSQSPELTEDEEYHYSSNNEHEVEIVDLTASNTCHCKETIRRLEDEITFLKQEVNSLSNYMRSVLQFVDTLRQENRM